MPYYYAQIKNNIVVNLIESETEMPASQDLIETKYNTFTGINISKEKAGLASNFCAVGYIFDPEGQGFYPVQPYASWTLNRNIWRWEPPIPYPTDGNTYSWNEGVRNWVKL